MIPAQVGVRLLEQPAATTYASMEGKTD
jgi:hypothetical protein